jgi:hypothetical protein
MGDITFIMRISNHRLNPIVDKPPRVKRVLADPLRQRIFKKNSQIKEEFKMTTIYKLMLTVCIILVFCGNAFSEPYTGKEFPSEEQLAKSINNLINCGFKNSIGKVKVADGSYNLFYQTNSDNPMCKIQSAIIIRLDTGIWVAGNQIIQK